MLYCTVCVLDGKEVSCFTLWLSHSEQNRMYLLLGRVGLFHLCMHVVCVV